MNEIYIVIPGEPYRKTHQSGTHIGQGRTYKDAGLREVESRLMEALKPNAPSAPWNGPIQLAVNFGPWGALSEDSSERYTYRPGTDVQGRRAAGSGKPTDGSPEA